MKATSILCGVTGSPGSELAARKAAELARETGSRLTYLYVVDVSFLQGLTLELRPSYAEAGLGHLGMMVLQDAARDALSLGVEAKMVLRIGKVLQAITQVAREEKADLLILGDEGRSGTEKLLFGGQVLDCLEEIERTTGAEVLVVR